MKKLSAAGFTAMIGFGAFQAGAADGDIRVGDAASYKGLTIFPITNRGAIDTTNYVSFDEAQKAGKVSVTERGNKSESAQVEEVFVSNASSRPLYLVGGEVILGGKQDRVIREDVVVPPLSQNFRVKVFCVEQGRWNGRSMAFRASDQMIHGKIREEAALGTQGDVWRGVAMSARKLKTTLSGGGSYRGVIDDRNVGAKSSEYVRALAPLLSSARTVGMIVAVGGRLIAVDVFQSPRLFARTRDKMIRSYAIQAIEAGGVASAEPSRSDAGGFFRDAMTAKPVAAPAALDASGSNAKYDDDKVKGTERKAKDGKWLHKSIYKKY
ncbi:MAG: hypothetical protein HYY84_03815 [Deltaproteobacteria bacterium]|nr:hypothetical protein [Deltaproteobacteria bacterium]